MKFRTDADELVGLRVLGAGEELLLVSEKGVIVRTSADAIPQQSRAATGFACSGWIREIVWPMWCLVPPEAETEDDNEASDDPNELTVAEQPSASEESEPSAED
jgi:DNA gyrase subunit A